MTQRDRHRSRSLNRATASHYLRFVGEAEARDLKRLGQGQGRIRLGTKLRFRQIESTGELMVEHVKRKAADFAAVNAGLEDRRVAAIAREVQNRTSVERPARVAHAAVL